MPSLKLKQEHSKVIRLTPKTLHSNRKIVSIPKAIRLTEDSQVYCYEFSSHDLEKFEFNCQAIPLSLSPMTRPTKITEVYCYEFPIMEDISEAV